MHNAIHVISGENINLCKNYPLGIRPSDLMKINFYKMIVYVSESKGYQ